MNLAIGPLSYKQDDQSFQKPFSEKTAELLDFEVRKMVQGAHRRTTELLMEKREEVIKVAELLLSKEVLSRFVSSRSSLLSPSCSRFSQHESLTSSSPLLRYREDMIALIGPRPHDTAEESEVMAGKLSTPPSGSSPLPTPKHVGESSPALGEGIEAGGGVAMPLATSGPPAL